MSDDDRNLTNAEAAEYLRLHPITLANYRAQGKGPKWRRKGEGDSGPIIYTLADLRAWERTRPGGGGA